MDGLFSVFSGLSATSGASEAAEVVAFGFLRVPRTFRNWSSDRTTKIERIWPEKENTNLKQLEIS